MIWLAVLALPAFAQTPDRDSAEGALSADRAGILSKVREVVTSDDLEPSLKEQVLDLYKRAEQAMKSAETLRAKTRIYRQAIEGFIKPTQPTPSPPTPTLVSLGISDETPLEEIERQLTKVQSDEAALAAKLSTFERRLGSQRDRPKQARAELSAKQEQAAELEQALATPVSADADNSTLAEAERRWRTAELEATSAEIELLDQELLSFEARFTALVADRDAAKAAMDAESEKAELLGNYARERRRQLAQASKRDAEQVREEAVGKHSAVLLVAEHNAELTQRLDTLVSDETRIADATDALEAKTAALEDDLKGYVARLEIAGLSRVLGKLFVDRRRRLDETDTQALRYEKGLERSIVEAGLGQLQAAEERTKLGSIDSAVGAVMASAVEADISAASRALISEQLSNLYWKQAELLERLETAYGTRSRALGNLEFELVRFEQVSARFRRFLDQNLLWIPNVDRVHWETLSVFPVALGFYLSTNAWEPLVHEISRDITELPGLYLLAGVIALFIAWNRGRLISASRANNNRIGHLHTDQFAYTAHALAAVLLAAVLWPLVLTFLGWRLTAGPSPDPQTTAVATLLFTLAAAVLPLGIMRRICAHDGLAEVHLRWRPRATGIIRRELRIFTWVLLPAICLGGQGPWVDDELRSVMGQLSLILIAGLLAFTVYRLTHPTRGALADKLLASESSLLNRTRWIWLTALWGTPISLVVLAGLGFQFTAVELMRNYYLTLWLITLAYLVHEVGLRWLELASARAEWVKVAERLRNRPATEEQDESELIDDPIVINFRSVSEQTHRLFHSVLVLGLVLVLWAIWSNILPAFGLLEGVRLWSYNEQVGRDSVIQHTTLVDLIVAAALGFLFAVATSSLPRLLELVLAQRVAFTAGTLNAITTITRYVLIGVGVVVVFNALGVGWSKVQWLVAAISVGLGFGLQEIFANFVSGLILLFERPVRIGDTVTVDGVQGTVTRIRIRATTIRDWDNKEIVVPNKTLITNQLTNWSLSDATVRIVLNVGIAYGSDTTLAHQIMLDVARAHPRVLETPAPTVYFSGLGASSLDFEVRMFVPEITDMFRTRHDYYMAIERRLAEAGIDIPFPQRDLHIKGWQPAQ